MPDNRQPRDHHRHLQLVQRDRRVPALARRRTPSPSPPRSPSSTTRRRDGTPAHMRASTGRRCRSIEAGGNLGFARANNLGIRATTQRLRAAAESGHRRAARRHPDAGARPAPHPDAAIAGPRLVDDRGCPELSFGPADQPAGTSCRQKTAARALLSPQGPALVRTMRHVEPAGARAWRGSAARAC